MKSWLLALSIAVLTPLAVAPMDAEARRLGGGKAAGMQRQMPAKPVDAAKPTPASPAATPGAAAAPAAAAAAAGKRSWMGPLAGLAAGLGLAALFSHFGMGEGLANFVMIALLAVAAVVAVRFIMARMRGGAAQAGMGGQQPAMAGAAAGAGGWSAPQAAPAAAGADTALQRQALDAPAVSSTAAPVAGAASASPLAAGAALPGGMAQEDFLRLAKMVYIRLQAANDAGNVDDLRKFTTPELFASLRLDLQERGGLAQKTDVVQLDAEIADVAQEGGQDVVSVRFHGLIREQAEGGAEPVNELWHLVRDSAGNSDWAIAGITPLA